MTAAAVIHVYNHPLICIIIESTMSTGKSVYGVVCYCTCKRGHSKCAGDYSVALCNIMIYDLNGLSYQYFLPLIKTTNNACGPGQKTHKHAKTTKA